MVTFCSAVFLVLCVLNTFSEIRDKLVGTFWLVWILLLLLEMIKNLIFDLKNLIFDLYTGLTCTWVNMINVFQKKKKKKTNHNFEHFLQVKMELEHLLVHKDWQHCGRCLSTRNIVRQHARFCRRPGCRVPDCESLR